MSHKTVLVQKCKINQLEQPRTCQKKSRKGKIGKGDPVSIHNPEFLFSYSPQA